MNRAERRRMTAEIEALVHDTLDRMQDARRVFPEADYSARIYRCPECGTVDGAIAPRAELVDEYACTQCMSPQVALFPAAP